MSRYPSSKLRKRRRTSVNPVFLSIIAAAALSAVIAGVWQIASPSPAESEQPIIDPALRNGPITSLGSALAAQPASAPVQEKPSPEVKSPGSASEPSPEPKIPVLPAGLVPEQSRVTSSYFDDAAFIGDSISTGIKLYDVMSNAEVFASVGTSLENIGTKQAIKDNGEQITILEALRRSECKKIYIMLGANSLGGGIDRAVETYSSLLDTILSQNPGTVIYIQSALPINEAIFAKSYNSGVTNAKIDEFNARLCALAVEKGLYYLDVASVFKDDTGSMPAEYTPDGLHINSAQYITWFDYLKTHAVS